MVADVLSLAEACRRRATSPGAEDGLRPQLGERRSPGLVVGAVDDEHPVEVIELVLDDPSGRLLELEPHGVLAFVESLDCDRNGTLDRNEHLAQRQTALVLDSRLLRNLGERRIDEHVIFSLMDENEDPPEDTDLGRSQADALRFVHEARHSLDEAREIGVEALDLPCLHPKRRIPVLPDSREREQSSCLSLELRVILRRFDVVLVVVLVIAFWHAASLASPQCRLP